MNKAIFYKEWIKVRWSVLAIIIIGIVIEIIMFLKLGRSFRFSGREHIWDVIVNRNQFLFSYIKYYPLAAGLILSIVQFLPEINNSRLKLSLHLPMKETNIITHMLGSISGLLLLLFLIEVAILILGLRYFFEKEIVNTIFLTVLPWFIAGLAGYLLFAFCFFEPLWKRRIINILLSFFILYLFFISKYPGAYSQAVLMVLLIPVICFLLVYYSVSRFKIGIHPI